MWASSGASRQHRRAPGTWPPSRRVKTLCPYWGCSSSGVWAVSMHDRTLGLTRPPAATALSILLNKGCTHTTKTHALSVPSTGTRAHAKSGTHSVQRCWDKRSYGDFYLLRLTQEYLGRKWTWATSVARFSRAKLQLRDLMLSAGVTHLSKTKTVLPWSPTETWISFPWPSEGSGNQWQTKRGGERPGWSAALSNRVRCLKLFTILDRNNLSTHSRALSKQQKKSQTRAPSLSHTDSCSVICTTWRWWLRWWFYCPQGIESGLGPHNLKYHHTISESWALPKITLCITGTFFISLLYV